MLSRVHKRHARGLLEHILRGGYEVQGISFIREDKKEDIVAFVNERLTQKLKMLRLNCSQMRIGLRGWSRVSSHKLSTLENAKPFEDIPAPPGKQPFRGFYYCLFSTCSTSAFLFNRAKSLSDV